MIPKVLVLLCLGGLISSTFAEEHVLVVDTNNFDSVVGSGDFVVEFYAPWCGHCKKLAPEYEKAAKILHDEKFPAKLAKCDADNKDNKPLAKKYGVKGFPTLKIFKKGNLNDPSEYNGGRTADEIVKAVKKAFGPASQLITTKEEVAEVTMSEAILIGVFGKEGKDFDSFMEAADSMRDDGLKIVHTFNPKLLEPCNADPSFCTGSMVFLLLGLDKNVTKFNGEIDPKELIEWARKMSVPKLAELIQDSQRHMDRFKAVFNLPEPRLIVLGTPEFKEMDKLKEDLIKLDEEDNSINVLYIDATKNSKSARFFDVKEEDYPAAVIHDHGQNLKYILKKFQSPQEIRDHVTKWKAKEIEPTIKSEEPPEDNSGPVKVVVAKTLSEVLSAGKDILLEFYAPWCGHCKQLAPTYEKLGKHFESNDKVTIAKMDAANNDIPDARLKIAGFPTLKYIKTSGEIVDYKGDRSLEDLIKFVKDQLGVPADETEPKAEAEETEPEDDSKEEL